MRTRAEALTEWGEKGKLREQQESLEYWKNIENSLPFVVREKVLKTVLLLQDRVERGRLKEATARERLKYLLRIAKLVHGNLDDATATAKAIMEFKGQLSSFIAAWNYYRKANNIKEELDVHRDRRRPLPILTPEPTLIASLSVPRKLKWQAYFRLRYETGARPSEPFTMRKQDINFDRELVRLGTLKGSGETLERELPVSPLLIEQLRTPATKSPLTSSSLKPTLQISP
ncbi:MAG: tyrosine-type recombinase/integrase [Candidatus Bathyarchaeia archaeon]